MGLRSASPCLALDMHEDAGFRLLPGITCSASWWIWGAALVRSKFGKYLALPPDDQGELEGHIGGKEVELNREKYFVARSPRGRENNWLLTIPCKRWLVLFRLYGSLEPWFDQIWLPGKIELSEGS